MKPIRRNKEFDIRKSFVSLGVMLLFIVCGLTITPNNTTTFGCCQVRIDK
jgi:hypothetical protein